MEKVKIASAIEKQWQDKTFLNITLEDGRVGSSSDMALKDKIGVEIELDVKEGKKFNDVQQYYFNLPKENKGGGFPKKDYTFEKRRVALECAVTLTKDSASLGKDTEALRMAENFFKFLNS